MFHVWSFLLLQNGLELSLQVAPLASAIIWLGVLPCAIRLVTLELPQIVLCFEGDDSVIGVSGHGGKNERRASDLQLIFSVCLDRFDGRVSIEHERFLVLSRESSPCTVAFASLRCGVLSVFQRSLLRRQSLLLAARSFKRA